MKKRVLAALLLAFSLSFALCACGSDDKSSKKSSKKSESSDDDYETENKSEKKKDKKSDSKKKKAKDEDFEIPEEAPAEEAPAEEVPAGTSLEEFINSAPMIATLDKVNESLRPSGLYCEFGAEGNDVIIFKYTFIEQINIPKGSKAALEDSFDQELVPILLEQGDAMTTELEGYGVYLKGIRVIILNADGDELYNKKFDV